MKFLKGVLVFLLTISIVLLSFVFIVTESFKAIVLKPMLLHEVIDSISLQDIVPLIMKQYGNKESNFGDSPITMSDEQIEALASEVLTNDLEDYIKEQVKLGVTEFYQFMNSETDDLYIEIKFPDLAQRIAESLPMSDLVDTLDLPSEICDETGVNCINLNDISNQELVNLFNEYFTGVEETGIQEKLEENIASEIPTSITITTDQLPAEMIDARSYIQLANYSGPVLLIGVVIFSIILLLLQKEASFMTIGGALISSTLPIWVIYLIREAFKIFVLNILETELPIEANDIVSSISGPGFIIIDYTLLKLANFALIMLISGACLLVIGIVLKRIFRSKQKNVEKRSNLRDPSSPTGQVQNTEENEFEENSELKATNPK